MKYFVFLLVSLHRKQIISYAGYTNDIKKRLKLHNTSKGAKFTRGRKWEIIYKKNYNTKSEAMQNEFKLKNDRLEREKFKNKFKFKNNIK